MDLIYGLDCNHLWHFLFYQFQNWINIRAAASKPIYNNINHKIENANQCLMMTKHNKLKESRKVYSYDHN